MSDVLVHLEEGVATLTLNRAQKHNAFDAAMIQELIKHLDELSGQVNVRVLVLKAEGKSFSAGADLGWMKQMAQYTEQENREDSMELAKLMRRLYEFPKPTIAVVQGACFGGGAGLVACCKIALCSTKASFCFSEAKLGLVPAAISPFVTQAIGPRAAEYLFLTAKRIGADEAKELGLCQVVCEPDKLEAELTAHVSMLLNNGPQALEQVRHLMDELSRQGIDPKIDAYTSELIAKLRVSPEGQEGLSAFFNQQQPKWSTP